MKRELKERLGQLGRAEGTSPAPSGLPADLVIRPAGRHYNSIEAIRLIASCGLTLLRAKRTIEHAMEHSSVHVHLPSVPDGGSLVDALKAAGFNASRLACEPIDAKAVREKLGLSQEQFALQFNLDLDSVRNWEQGRHRPDRASTSYLRVIARRPREVAAAQEEDLQ